jgi:hypothetical protein
MHNNGWVLFSFNKFKAGLISPFLPELCCEMLNEYMNSSRLLVPAISVGSTDNSWSLSVDVYHKWEANPDMSELVADAICELVCAEWRISTATLPEDHRDAVIKRVMTKIGAMSVEEIEDMARLYQNSKGL